MKCPHPRSTRLGIVASVGREPRQVLDWTVEMVIGHCAIQGGKALRPPPRGMEKLAVTDTELLMLSHVA